MVVVLGLPKRLPKLDRYHFAHGSAGTESKPLSESEWVLKQAEYTKSGFRNKAILFSPSEDGLVCVSVILAGISLASAILGGLIFGFLHLGRFTYLDCIGKAIIYGLVCFLVLPHGLLTVITGHFGMNLFAWMALKVTLKMVKSKAAGQHEP